MRCSIPIAFTILLAACAPSARPPETAPPNTTAQLDGDERAVLAVVIDSLAGTDRPFVLIADRTDGSDLDASRLRWAAREANLPGELVSWMWRDFARRNAVAAEVTADLPSSVPVRTYRYEEHGDPQRITAANPPARSLLMISRPGFDRSRTTAVVWHDYWCPGLCGGSGVAFLRLTPAGWQYVEGIPLTIA